MKTAGFLKPSLAAAAVAGSLALVGCGSSSSTPSTSTNTTSGATSQANTGTVSAPPAGSVKLTLQADPAGSLAFRQTSLTASAGSVTIVFENTSGIGHNVAVADSSGKVLGSTPIIMSGSRTLTLTLAKGTYTYYCTVPGHRQAGMQGTLTVS